MEVQTTKVDAAGVSPFLLEWCFAPQGYFTRIPVQAENG